MTRTLVAQLLVSVALIATTTLPASASETTPRHAASFSPASAYGMVREIHAESNEGGLASAIADVTGDGRNDVLLTTQGTSGHLWIYRQLPDGTLAAPSSFDLGPTTYLSDRISVGDLNADGKTDAAVATPAGVEVFLQSGGTLDPPQLLSLTGTSHAAVGDITGDGKDDVVVTAGSGVTLDFVLFAQTGSGFGAPQTIGAGNGSVDLATADFGGDGRLDVLGASTTAMTLLHQEPGGAFTASTFPFKVRGYSIAAGDLTGDGHPDVVVGENSKLQIFAGKANGSFADPIVRMIRGFDVLLADDNSDGRLDIFDSEAVVNVARQLPDGSFNVDAVCPFFPATFGIQSMDGSLSVGDISGDGKAEFVLATNDPAGMVVYRPSASAPSDLTLDALTQPTYVEGPVTLKGQFFPRDSCPATPPLGQKLDILQSHESEPAQIVGQAVVGKEGDYTFVAAPDQLGEYTYTVRWGGDPLHASNERSLTTTALPRDDVLSIKARDTTFGGSTTWTVSLLAPHATDNRTVSVYETPVGGIKQLITTAEVDAETGLLTGTLSNLRVNFTLDVHWAGDVNFSAEDAHADVGVKVIVTGTLLRYHGTSGKYRLYRPSDTVFFKGQVTPRQPGHRVYWTLERERFGSWKTWVSEHFKLGPKSTVIVYFPASVLRPSTHYRMRWFYGGGTQNDPGSSRPAYFKLG